MFFIKLVHSQPIIDKAIYFFEKGFFPALSASSRGMFALTGWSEKELPPHCPCAFSVILFYPSSLLSFLVKLSYFSEMFLLHHVTLCPKRSAFNPSFFCFKPTPRTENSSQVFLSNFGMRPMARIKKTTQGS